MQYKLCLKTSIIIIKDTVDNSLKHISGFNLKVMININHSLKPLKMWEVGLSESKSISSTTNMADGGKFYNTFYQQ